MTVAVGSASAVDDGHAFSHSFKPSGTAALGSYLPAIAVDNSSGPSGGDIYVADYYHYRIEKFDPEGHFILMFGDEVNATTGSDVCTASSGNTCKAGNNGSAAERFECLQSIAVDGSGGPSAGDVYVADSCQRKVHKYDEDGNLITSWGEGGRLNGSSVEGGPFIYILGIAVDSSGQLLVSWESQGNSTEQTKVFKFAQDGTFATQIATAAGDTGNAFAWTPGYVFRMREAYLRRSKDSDGSETLTISRNPYCGTICLYPRSLAADPTTGTILEMMENYSGGLPRIWEWKFNGSGQPLDSAGNPCSVTLTVTGEGCDPTHEFGSEVLTQSNGVGAMAVDASDGTVYVTDPSGPSVDVFVAAAASLSMTEGASWRSTVSGTAKPDGAGNITECYFEYGESTAYGSTVPCEGGLLPYSVDQAVTAELPGLEGDGHHIYHYRLITKNANGAVGFGEDKTITPLNVKGLTTLDAENLTRTTATLKGSYEDIGEETKYYFEWGQTASYGNTSAAPPGEKAESATLSFVAESDEGRPQLQPETTYHYRIVAENGYGLTYGEDKTFQTLPAVQSLTTEAANPVERRSATLHASFNGDGDGTTYTFEWGKTESYGNTTDLADAGSPTGHTPISAQIGHECGEPVGCLELETTYHYRVVATNSLGTTKGQDQSFTTPPAVVGAVTKPATEIGQERITLNGEYRGNGEDTHYYFEYGLTPEYGQVSMEAPGSDAGEPSTSTEVSSQITDYEAYETYHYRLVISNEYGITYGNDETFTALAAPLPDISGTNASNVTPTGATLEAEINPNRWQTVYAFEYGTTEAYGESTEISDLSTVDKSMHPVSETIDNLIPGTAYHYRVVAINFTGTAYGPDGVLNTPAPPRVDSSGDSSIGQTTAHLSGQVTPNSSAAIVHFDYGTTASYGNSTPAAAVGSDMSSHAVGADVGGLAPGTTYHFRVVATNGIGTTYGPDQTLTTVAAREATLLPSNGKCESLSRRASQLARRAKSLGRTNGRRTSRGLRRRARNLSTRAHKLRNKAKSCEGAGS